MEDDNLEPTSWMSWLPLGLRRRLKGRERLKAVVDNTAWLVGDRFLRLGVGLFVGGWVTRHLGATGFGLLSWSLAFAGLFAPLASLGLNNVVVNELVMRPGDAARILGTAMVLRLVAGFVSAAAAVAVALATGARGLALGLVALAGAGAVFNALEVADNLFQARLKSKRAVGARVASFIAASAARVALILAGAGVAAFAWLVLAEAALAALLLVLSCRRGDPPFASWRFNRGEARRLLGLSWPLVFSGFAIAIYMRIDQVMLQGMASAREVGVYAVAVKLSELWYFLPVALVSSAYPAILAIPPSARAERRQKLERLFMLLAALGLTVALATSFAAHWVVRLLYGTEFADAGPVLAVHIWAGLSVALGLAKENWLVSEGLTRFSLLTVSSGAVLNVLLNLWLIPRWGPLGAAWATVASQVAANQVAPAFYGRTRPVFWLQLKALRIWRFRG